MDIFYAVVTMLCWFVIGWFIGWNLADLYTKWRDKRK